MPTNGVHEPYDELLEAQDTMLAHPMYSHVHRAGQPGSYPFGCLFHLFMQGTLVVQGCTRRAAAAARLPATEG